MVVSDWQIFLSQQEPMRFDIYEVGSVFNESCHEIAIATESESCLVNLDLNNAKRIESWSLQ